MCSVREGQSALHTQCQAVAFVSPQGRVDRKARILSKGFLDLFYFFVQQIFDVVLPESGISYQEENRLFDNGLVSALIKECIYLKGDCCHSREKIYPLHFWFKPPDGTWHHWSFQGKPSLPGCSFFTSFPDSDNLPLFLVLFPLPCPGPCHSLSPGLCACVWLSACSTGICMSVVHLIRWLFSSNS